MLSNVTSTPTCAQAPASHGVSSRPKCRTRVAHRPTDHPYPKWVRLLQREGLSREVERLAGVEERLSRLVITRETVDGVLGDAGPEETAGLRFGHLSPMSARSGVRLHNRSAGNAGEKHEHSWFRRGHPAIGAWFAGA